MSEALNQTFGNTEQVQGNSEIVDTQSEEYLNARQAFFDNMDKQQDIVKDNEPTQENQSIVKEEQSNGLRQEEKLINQTEEIIEQKQEQSDEEEPTQEETSSDNPQQPTTKTRQKRQYKIRANGQDFDFTIDDLKLMASKGVNYTQKLQKLAPFRKMLSAIEDEGITEADINQFIEMRKGNKDAIGAFTKKHNIALSDIEEGEKATNYRPQSYGREPTPLNEVDTELAASMNPQNYDKMCRFFNNELDNDSVNFFVENPEALRNLSNDIESGVFEQIRQEIRKGDMLDKYKKGVPFIQKYIYEAKKIEESKNNQQVTQQQTIGEKEIDKTQLGLSGTRNIPDKTNKVINSINELDDEEYQAWYKKVMPY